MAIGDVTAQQIYLARRRIASVVRRTLLIPSPALGETVGASVYLKPESLQETGSFKIRGATNKMLSLTRDEKARGVITISTGSR